ncbi:hypothetical protein CPB85DRAFT_1430169 [Mucidula mucida]|nr:hypothetical protein CPB85DRAFT_1430169 [Mucidula mucida]
MPVLQLSFFVASDAYRKSPRLPESLLRTIQGSRGHIWTFNGVQNESEAENWEYLLSPRESGYLFFIDSFSINGDVPLYQDFEGSSSLPLRSDDRIRCCVAQGGLLQDRLMELMAGQNASLDKAVRAYPPCFCIPTIDDANVILVIVGWDSREVHLETVSNEPFQALIHGMSQSSDIVMFHADMISY